MTDMATPAGYKHSPWKLKPYRQGRHCPVTAGHPSRMTEATFSRLCAAKQAAANDAICIECNGAMPPELEILEQLIMEDAMTTRNSWEGVCYLCGEKKTVRRMKDEKQCCGTCEHIYRNAVNNPGLLVEALRKGQGEDYISQPPTHCFDCDKLHASAVLEQIRATYNLESIDSIPDFVDNLNRASNMFERVRADLGLDRDGSCRDAVLDLKEERDSVIGKYHDEHRRAHAAETVIKDIRALLTLEPDESIIETVAELRRKYNYTKSELHDSEGVIDLITEKVGYAPGETVLDGVERMLRERQEAVDSMYEIRGLMGIDKDESIIDAISGLRREWQHAVKLCTETLAMLGADGGTNLNNLPQLAAELFASNDRRRHHIADLEAIVDGDQIQPTIGEIVHDTRTSTLLDLALDVIAGRVSGIDADRIAALR